ncbi:hypothetical protein LTR08_006827 [Meristemomyces frigidus]|nr:hypothetical protein LTR08_006827 [Meristemomyces frigidus]
MDQSYSDNGLEPPHMRLPYTPPPQTELNSVDDVAGCYGNGGLKSSPAKKKMHPERPESLGAMLRRGMVEHQLGVSVNLILLVGMSYILFPALRSRMSAFFWLSYPSSKKPGWYDVGERDVYLVGSFIVFFTALRAFSLEYLLMPVAGWAGIGKRKGRARFVEQSYMMIYYGIYWTWGLVLFIRETPSDVHDQRSLLISLWSGWPYLYLSASMKVYYLSQLAFWIQQIAVIHIEERRKDHVQMLTHHFITVSLIAGSYPYYQSRAGNAVLVCMDIVDFIFPLAKILKYVGLPMACDCAFGTFVVSWFVTRHVMYMTIVWSLYAHTSNVVLHYGRYSTTNSAYLSSNATTDMVGNLLQSMLHPDAQSVSWNPKLRWTFIGMLLALQCLTIVWFVMICRVVLKVVRGGNAEDTRSGDEDEDEDEEEKVDKNFAQPSTQIIADPKKPRFIEVEATSEELYSHYPKRSREGSSGASKSRKSKGISSGLNLGEHKDFLNRIGCLSEEQLAREREKREAGSMSPRAGSAGGKK